MRVWKRAAKTVALCALAAGSIFTGAAWAVGTSPDVAQVARAEITIDGHSLAVFQRCMIASEVEEVGTDPTTHEIRCERAITRNIEMAAWHELVLLGDAAAARKSFSVTMYDAAGDPVLRWHVTDGFPSAHTTYFDEAGFGREIVTLSAELIQRVSV